MDQVLVQIPVGIFLCGRIHYFFRSSRQFWRPGRHIDIHKTASVKLHSMFLRTGCMLPDGIDLRQEQFAKSGCCRRYDSFCSGRKIRNAGRHFMCFQDAYFRFASGGTAESAIGKAINLALHQVKGRFDAAELDSINVSRYPGC